MILHHLNCATMCPLGARLVNGRGGLTERGVMICHVLLLETPDGLALVDTGLGLGDVADPRGTLGSSFVVATAPRLDVEETAARQVARLGYDVGDVRHLIVTHLDLDHAGGIPDFPKAKVHVFAREHAAAMARSTMMERNRYRPSHFLHRPDWSLHEESAGESWFGFGAVREVVPKTSDVLLIPLHGHTRGHAGVAIREPGGWFLHAGDAYFYHRELDPEPYCPPFLALFQGVVAMDDGMRRRNQQRLRTLRADHGAEVTIVSAHDPVELERERARRSKRSVKAASAA